MERKNITQQCAKDPSSFGCFLDGDNMYGQFTVEVDGLWGPYEECNPVSVGGDGRGGMPDGSGWTDTQNFQCGQDCLNPTREKNCSGTSHSSWDQPRNGSSREGGFNCFCADTEQRDLRAVGREPKGGKNGYAQGPINLPQGWYQPTPQCSDGFEPPCLVEGPKSRYGQQCKKRGGCLTGTAVKTIKGWSFDSTSSLACDACTSDADCTGWAITSPDNTTAELFHGAVTVKKDINCVSASRYKSHYGGGGGRSWYGVDAGPGFWFNTPVEGMCAEGQALGGLTVEGRDRCTWRVAETVKYANASCIDGQVRCRATPARTRP